MRFNLDVNGNRYQATSSLPDGFGFGLIEIMVPNDTSEAEKSGITDFMQRTISAAFRNESEYRLRNVKMLNYIVHGTEEVITAALNALGVNDDQIYLARVQQQKEKEWM